MTLHFYRYDISTYRIVFITKMRFCYRDYSLTPILYELTPIIEKLNTVVAYVKKDSNINKMADLRGKRIALPKFDGVAWHSIIQHLIKNNEIDNCNIRQISQYFGDSCVPGIERNANISADIMQKLTKNCYRNNAMIIKGETEALRSLIEDKSDVAFLNLNTFKRYTGMYEIKTTFVDKLSLFFLSNWDMTKAASERTYCILAIF